VGLSARTDLTPFALTAVAHGQFEPIHPSIRSLMGMDELAEHFSNSFWSNGQDWVAAPSPGMKATKAKNETPAARRLV